MTSLEKLGKKIVTLRRAKGMSQEDLAGKADMDRSYLSELENGHKNPSVLMLEKIAKALDIKTASLLDD